MHHQSEGQQAEAASRLTVLVQVLEALGGAERDGEPLGPVHDRQVLPVEVALEGVVGDALVDEQALRALGAAADEADQVLVLDAGDHVHLHEELRLALPRLAHAQLLHRHFPAVVQLPLHNIKIQNTSVQLC